MRAVNNLFTPKREKVHQTQIQMYQRPESPSRRVPGAPGILSEAKGHSPGGILLPQAASGLHGAPRAAGLTGPPGWLAGDASEAATRPPCALRAAASAPRACLPCWVKRRRRLQRRARTCSDLPPLQLPDLPPRQLPRQPAMVALRWPCGGLHACGA